MSFEIPKHLLGEPFVKELIQEINALVNENSVLHQRLKIQSSTIDKLLLEKNRIIITVIIIIIIIIIIIGILVVKAR